MSFDILEFLKALITLAPGTYLREVFGTSPGLEVIMDIVGIVVVSTFCLLIVIGLIWLERKVIARMQDRVGPNRVGGKYGLLQTVADVLKLLTKENITPTGADKLSYNMAPMLIVMFALLMWAVMPFAPGVIGVDLNIGLFYILAVSSVSVVTLLFAGWGSNNKYALLGAFRAVAQMVSYEVPMVISLLVPILLTSSMGMTDIIDAQPMWYIFVVPLSALIFFISALAETGRTPFDLLEAESEIVAGFHVEYTGMKFGMFFLAEFVSTLFMSGLFATVYLGGYRFFGLEQINIGGNFPIGNLFGLVIFFVKTFMIYFVFMWIRATLPRIRVDQMLAFNWKFLVPVTLVMLLDVAIIEKIMLSLDTGIYLRGFVHLVSNLLLGVIVLEILRRQAKKIRWANVEGEEVVGGFDRRQTNRDEIVLDGAGGHGHDAHAHAH